MANKRLKPEIAVGFACVLTAASWLCCSDKSPTAGLVDRLGFGDATNMFFGIAQLPATFLDTLISGNVHGGGDDDVYWSLAFVQWLLIGLLVAKLFARLGKSGKIEPESVNKSGQSP